MSLSMYEISVPVFVKMLGNLSKIITKASQYAETKKFDATVLVNARLAPDMFPFSRQIQIACDAAKGCGARLAGVEVPSHPDNEASLAELQARIAKTVQFLEGVPQAAINESAARDIALKVGGQEMHFKGLPYLLHFVLPNFYFHLTTAYAILRHQGLEIGKGDYLGR